MIPIKKLNDLIDITFLCKNFINTYLKNDSKEDHELIEAVRKQANDMLNWCDDCTVKRW